MKEHITTVPYAHLIVMFLAALFFLPVAQKDIHAKEVQVHITSPRNGEKIVLSPGEPMPAQRPIEGHVEGITGEELAGEQLLIHVSIQTDKWYPQGIASVKSDGSWKIRTAHFGGAVHIIKAVLKDQNGNELASTSVKVTITQ